MSEIFEQLRAIHGALGLIQERVEAELSALEDRIARLDERDSVDEQRWSLEERTESLNELISSLEEAAYSVSDALQLCETSTNGGRRVQEPRLARPHPTNLHVALEGKSDPFTLGSRADCSTPIHDEVLVQFTGQRDVRNVAEAEEMVLRARAKLKACALRRYRNSALVLWHGLRYFAAKSGISPIVASVIVSSLIVLMSLVVMIGAWELSLGTTFLLMGTGYVASLAMVFPVLADWSPDERANRALHRRAKWRMARQAASESRHDLADSRKELRAARRLMDGLRAAQQSAINRLLLANFDYMDGRQFEQFLAEVFRFHGYSVTLTSTTGDWGVDLVVEREGVRVAIQAKRHTGRVGNSAVRDAHAGKDSYRCQKCAVITNSFFSAAAVRQAASLGCVLIDRDGLADLIRGRIRL